MEHLHEIAALCTELVIRASRICREIQADLAEIQARNKDDRSPVTVADYASQALVAAGLMARYGSVGLVAEEGATMLGKPEHATMLDEVVRVLGPVWPQVTGQAVLDAVGHGAYRPERDEALAEYGASGYFTLDPIDGTRGFLRGGQYAISLAWIVDGRPAVGVLGCPNLARSPASGAELSDGDGSLAIAVRGEGAQQLAARSPQGDPRPIAAVDPAEDAPIIACASLEPAHTDGPALARILEFTGSPTSPIRMESQCKYLLVARGQAHAYLRVPIGAYLERSWDHAAGALIAEASGCTVTDLDGKPLNFAAGSRLEGNRGILCAPPRAHARLRGAVQALAI